MRAGKRDRQITIQSLTEGRDSVGGITKTWGTLATVWAEVIFLKGREVRKVAQVTAESELAFRFPYRNDVTEKCRIQYDGKTYDIQSIAEVGRREGLEVVGKRSV